jgi:hypothetical protein
MEKDKLRQVLEEELKTMYRLIAVMYPTSEAEFIAVALPNLHLRMFELLKNN